MCGYFTLRLHHNKTTEETNRYLKQFKTTISSPYIKRPAIRNISYVRPREVLQKIICIAIFNTEIDFENNR